MLPVARTMCIYIYRHGFTVIHLVCCSLSYWNEPWENAYRGEGRYCLVLPPSSSLSQVPAANSYTCSNPGHGFVNSLAIYRTSSHLSKATVMDVRSPSRCGGCSTQSVKGIFTGRNGSEKCVHMNTHIFVLAQMNESSTGYPPESFLVLVSFSVLLSTPHALKMIDVPSFVTIQ